MARSCTIVVVATAVLVATGVVQSNSDTNGYAQVGVVDTPEVSEPRFCRVCSDLSHCTGLTMAALGLATASIG